MDKLRNIVVPTDFSALARAATARAISLARVDGAAVHVVHALAFPMVLGVYDVSLPPPVASDLRAAARWKLEQIRKEIEASGVQNVTAELTDADDAVIGIAEAVKAHRADLVVIGTHGRRGFERAFLGSVAERTLRLVEAPVLAVKEDPETAANPIAHILLAVDFSAHSDRAVAAAADLASRLSATVDVIHAFHLPPDYNPYLSALGTELERKIEEGVFLRLAHVQQQLESRGLHPRIHFRRGRPEVVIADIARQIGCQLVVMGTRGQGGVSHVLLGSVAERTLRAAPCSVLCVKTGESSRLG
jgi:nucleotide-binding universal stress UspA family protein